MRLMLVEDNKDLAGFLAKGLRAAGFIVDAMKNGAEAQEALAMTAYDALVLDLGLPDMDGMALLKEIRLSRNETPIMILTARDGIGDRVRGLDAGADDYVLKPVAIEELSARLRALLRRPAQRQKDVIGLGNVSLRASSREVEIAGLSMVLPRRERCLLEELLRRPAHVIARASLEERMYGYDDEISPNSLEIVVSRLRKVLRESGADIEIMTFRGLGYMLRKIEE